MVEIPAKSRGGPPATAMAGPSRGASLCGIVPAANHSTRKLNMHMYACPSRGSAVATWAAVLRIVTEDPSKRLAPRVSAAAASGVVP